MRLFITLVPAAFLLAACANTGDGVSTYQTQVDQLRQQCLDSGGMFIPVGVGNTGNPGTDYVCQRRDGGSRLN